MACFMIARLPAHLLARHARAEARRASRGSWTNIGRDQVMVDHQLQQVGDVQSRAAGVEELCPDPQRLRRWKYRSSSETTRLTRPSVRERRSLSS